MDYILGVLVSVLIQPLKTKLGLTAFATQVAVLSLALIGATSYVIFSGSPYWTVVINVLTTAGAFHNFILRKFE